MHEPPDQETASSDLFRRLELIQERTLSLCTRTELAAVLKAIVDLASEITGADFCALGVDPGQQDLPFDPWVFTGAPSAVAEGIGRHPRPVGVLGAVIREGRSIRLDDVSRDSRFCGFPPGHPEMGAFIGAPLCFQDRCVGHLYVAKRPGEPPFSEANQWMLEFLARNAAAAIEHIGDFERFEREIQARTQAEKAAREREHQWRMLFESALDAMLIIDDAGTIVEANAAMCALTGRSREELHDLPQFVLVDRRNEAGMLAMRHALHEHGELRGEFELIHADGTPRYVEFTGRAHFAPILHLTILHDITERKRAEVALRRSEARMARAQRLVRLGHVEVDLRTREWHWADEALRIFGYDPAEVPTDLRDAVDMLVVLEDRERVWHRIEQVIAGEGPLEVEYRIVRPDGEVRHLRSMIELERDSQGAPSCLLGTIDDVTDRRRAQKEREALFLRVQTKRRWLAAVIENAPVAIILLEGQTGEQLTVNRQAATLFGRELPPGAGIDFYLEQVYRLNGRPLEEERRPSKRVLRGEEVADEELLIRQPSGREVPVRLRAAAIRPAGDTVQGAIIAFEDLSAVWELERLREEWTSVIAHDLRQPVTSIYMLAQLLPLRSSQEPAELKKRVQHILSSAKQLNRMISDLLDVSRIEARNLELRPEPVDLKTLLQAIVERSIGELNNQPLEIDARGDIPELRVDPGRLEQALSNLLSNAAKYGTPGTPIRVRVERATDHIHVSVTNQGHGISADELPKLFERFSRTSRAITGKKAGVGLGLYITRGLIEAHGGRIWAESAPGLTTTFHFTLPLER